MSHELHHTGHLIRICAYNDSLYFCVVKLGIMMQVVEAAKRGFTGKGIELNLWLVWFSKLSAFRHGVSKSASFQRKDIFKTQLSSYDNVVIFGVDTMVFPSFYYPTDE